ncbi:hypothetical protein [Cyanobium sp. Morenito 9A2]|uniref:hypothetical protein n=1 Tax=Cyanobium sp. Morenito 9A2 TaxID=2823718 RepID=UPI0020CF6EA6|nr:hypothetical protein [Cyanobium sp. Morenito 9A2]MCP9848792.1 hypothetical protein [Cyanobium sp. Morenito 9A2]
MTGSKRKNPFDAEKFRLAGAESGTDKVLHHGYHRFYPQFLAPLRQRKREFGIVEIGYGQGNSIIFWKSLFPSAHVYCLDRDVSLEGEGYTVLKVDQSDLGAMEKSMQSILHSVPLIIDDGSHFPPHQLTSFSILFEELLEQGGVYIIEDIETSYWNSGDIYGYPTRFGLYSPWSAVEILKHAVDYLNRNLLSQSDRNLVEYSMLIAGLSPQAVEAVSTLTFAQNCVIATKIIPEDKAYIERPYHFSEMTAR